MIAAGLEPRIREVRASDRELGYLAAKSILTQPPVTAVFAGNDQVAVGVYRAFRDAGIAIPGDISVVGFNDTEGEILYPRLTTVREFPEELGKHLAELVLRCISVPDAETQQVVLPTQLIRRESSRPLSPNDVGSPPATFKLATVPMP
jgi:DNA-binding LacI/PurR family transcriptional regulator